MIKRYIPFIISISTVFFVIGCPPKKLETSTTTNIKQNQSKHQITETEKIKTPEIKNETIEPEKPKPEIIETQKIEPEKVETQTIKPDVPEKIETKETKTETIEPEKTEPEIIEPQKIEPEIIETREIKTEIIEPEKTEPEIIEPQKIEPQKIKPEKSKPAETETKKTAQTEKKSPTPTVPKTTSMTASEFHDKAALILKNYVDENGLVDYYTLRLRPNRLKLKDLLDEFAKLEYKVYKTWTKEDKIAFWLNAYNLQMLKIIIDNYPIQSTKFHRVIWPSTSIRNIKPWGITGVKKWDRFKFIVMDEQFTLSEINQRFFVEEFAEPKIFFAVSHASLSSPPLRNEPYYGSKLYQQLDDQIKKFLSSRQAFKIDWKKQEVYLSTIFTENWYGRNFIQNYGTDKKFKEHPPIIRAILNFLTNYISKSDASFLEVKNYDIEYIRYDWRLNDTKSP